MTKSFVCLTQYLRNHTSYDCEFWCTCVNQFVLLYISGTVDHIIEILIIISTGVFLQFLNFVNIKTICFLLAHFNSFNNYLFFKFISKCQKEILRCASPSSRVCDILLSLCISFFGMPSSRCLAKQSLPVCSEHSGFPCTLCRTSLFFLDSLKSYDGYSKTILTVFNLHHLASSFCVIQYQHRVSKHILPILLQNLYSSPVGQLISF